MTYRNRYCADAGTVNCPCPLAETGDCLICGRLSGKETCDCHWAGLCIYNEFMQNDGVVRNPRKELKAKILQKTWYDKDLLMLELEVSREMALNAVRPGAFVFLRAEGTGPFFDTPVSVMTADVQKGALRVVLKIISGKTKQIAEAEGALLLRGIYRNGLLGSGLEGLEENLREDRSTSLASTSGKRRKNTEGKPKKWLFLTRGAGFAPAVNLLKRAAGRVDVHMIIDAENLSEAMVCDILHEDAATCSKDADAGTKICMAPLHELIREDSCQKNVLRPDIRNYDRVFILASDYYIRTLSEALTVPHDKLIFSNNFHMCCGEGICGACGHVDGQGNLSKMCKCGHFRAEELRG